MYTTDKCELLLRITAIDKELRKLGEVVETLSRLPATGAGHAAGGTGVLACLRKFLTACERTFSIIHAEIDGKFARSWDWRSRLLQNLDVSLAGVRPPVVSSATRRQLQKLLMFLSLERNIYGYLPDADRLAEFSQLIIVLYPQLLQEIELFNRFLAQRCHQPQVCFQIMPPVNQPAASVSFCQMPKTFPSGS
jgi:hypothetical protein